MPGLCNADGSGWDSWNLKGLYKCSVGMLPRTSINFWGTAWPNSSWWDLFCAFLEWPLYLDHYSITVTGISGWKHAIWNLEDHRGASVVRVVDLAGHHGDLKKDDKNAAFENTSTFGISADVFYCFFHVLPGNSERWQVNSVMLGVESQMSLTHTREDLAWARCFACKENVWSVGWFGACVYLLIWMILFRRVSLCLCVRRGFTLSIFACEFVTPSKGHRAWARKWLLNWGLPRFAFWRFSQLLLARVEHMHTVAHASLQWHDGHG